MIESISPEHLVAIFAALIALAEAVYAALKKAEVKTVTAEKEDVIRFYDQDNTTPVPEDVVKQLPKHTYTMSDDVKKFALNGLPPEDRVAVVQQIADAEAAGKVKYVVTYSGGWYLIEHGLIAGGGDGQPPAI